MPYFEMKVSRRQLTSYAGLPLIGQCFEATDAAPWLDGHLPVSGGTIANMTALKARGIGFSMGDFGTGYSSLQYLKRLPLDQLKIDRSFVHDIVTDDSDKAIVRTIIAMAQNLNLNIIAEGVETVAQLQLLQERGCTTFQGYLLGKPIPVEQFEALLKQG